MALLTTSESSSPAVLSARRAALPPQTGGVLAHSGRDAWLVALAGLHGILLLAEPSILLIALGLWWNSNTIAHNFLHLPFFRRRAFNRLFAAYESALLGIPQQLWKERHLAHHADRPWRWRWSRQLGAECSLVAVLWAGLLAWSPEFMLTVYWPGWLLGLLLCQAQGFFEHFGGTASYHGRFYNLAFFNDGMHAEHHAAPARHWSRLQPREFKWGRASHWPPVLRWIEGVNLDWCERAALRFEFLQRFLVRRHRSAFLKLLHSSNEIRTIGIVGGGLFPRTVLVLQQILPAAQVTVIESNGSHIRIAKEWSLASVKFVNQSFDEHYPETFDLLILPLAFRGNKEKVLGRRGDRIILTHDWIWRRSPSSAIISWLLLKRLNRHDP